MKVILLAAGRSVRMQPLADKNFLEFCGKPLVAHQMEALKKAGFRDILIIAGRHNLKQLEAFGAPVREQKDLDLGMAGAVMTARKWIGENPFLVVSANDILDASAYTLMGKALKKNEGLLLARKVSRYFPGGYLELNRSGLIQKIIEKPGEGNEPSNLINIVMHCHPEPHKLFEALEKVATSRDDRYEKALQLLFDAGVSYSAVPFTKFWQPLKYPWHVLDLTKYFLENLANFFPRGRIGGKKAQVAKSAKISGDVYLGDGVKVMDNAVIVGPAYIGPNTIIANGALVRASHIGAHSVIGFGSEVARSYVGNHVWTHTNYIGDSIIGDNVSFGAGTVTGNLRLDEKNIFVNVNGERVNTCRTKLGLIAGSDIRAGINTSFMPGVKVGSHSFIGAGITIAKDVPEGSYVTGEWKLKVEKNREKICTRNVGR